MNKPIVICEDSFQVAWAKAIMSLNVNRWDAWNVVVQIDCPDIFDESINDLLDNFAKTHDLILPKHVAHTIFPQTFYKGDISRKKLYKRYKKFYKWSRTKPHRGWGTYFWRMIMYSTPNGDIDQLGSIIDNINNRQRNYGASYMMVIPYPHKDLNKLMGAPCLNYISIQVEITNKQINEKTINLMAVYRNHDFIERTYGNYLGLCNLIKYIANETGSLVGTLTCISSHAFVLKNKSELLELANTIIGATR